MTRVNKLNNEFMKYMHVHIFVGEIVFWSFI